MSALVFMYCWLCLCFGFTAGWILGQRKVVRMHAEILAELHSGERKPPKRAERLS